MNRIKKHIQDNRGVYAFVGLFALYAAWCEWKAIEAGKHEEAAIEAFMNYLNENYIPKSSLTSE